MGSLYLTYEKAKELDGRAESAWKAYDARVDRMGIEEVREALKREARLRSRLERRH